MRKLRGNKLPPETNGRVKRVVLAFLLGGRPGRRKLKSILDCLRERGLDWQVHILREQEHFTARLVRSFPERKIDGVIFSMPAARKGGEALAELDIPTVALDIYDESILRGRTRNLAYIRGSAEDTGRAAAQNLMAQGCFRSYGFVPDLQGSAWGRLRGAAFVDEIASRGLPVARYCVRRKDYDLPELTRWIARLPKPVGIFAAYDDRAVQVLEACREAGLAVPDDVGVLGVDNDETLCSNTMPPLSSVQPDHEQLGRLATELLDRMMNGRALDEPVRRVVGVREIAIRESTSAVSQAGRLVQRAMAFIRAHATEAIKPKDVAEHLKVSRSLADLRFRELQGESMGRAILRQRLEEVRRRLISTSDTIDNIAAACHFHRVDRLREAFKAAYGRTMGEYRN